MASFAIRTFETNGNSTLSAEPSNAPLKLVPIHLSHIFVRGATQSAISPSGQRRDRAKA